jgi:(2Fe-2S) ferredoxin
VEKVELMEVLRDFKFVVEDHDKLNETLTEVAIGESDCHFCQSGPMVIVYRGFDDKIVVACKEHEEIVLEMIERAHERR